MKKRAIIALDPTTPAASHYQSHFCLAHKPFTSASPVRSTKLSKREQSSFSHLGVETYLGSKMYTAWHLDSTSYGASFLDSIIREHKPLDHAVYAFQHVDAKNYEAPFRDSIISDPEHLDHALDTFRHLDAETYGAHFLDSIIHDPEHLDHALDTFQHVDGSYVHSLFSTVSEVKGE